jgi:hypothetical protein
MPAAITRFAPFLVWWRPAVSGIPGALTCRRENGGVHAAPIRRDQPLHARYGVAPPANGSGRWNAKC